MEDMAGRINRDGIRPLYLIHGENEYLRELNFSRLLELSGREMEPEQVDEKASPETLAAYASMPSMFSGGKLLIQRNPQWLVRGDDASELLKWAADPVPGNRILLLMNGKADGRKKAFKELSKREMVIDCPLPGEWELPRWIEGRFREQGIRISKEAAGLLQARAGNSQAVLDGEIRKIILYAGKEREIGTETVELLASHSAASGIFDLMDAFSARDGKNALTHLRSLIQMREPEVKILFMLVRQLRILYQGKLLLLQGCDDSRIVRELEVNPYVWKKARGYLSGLSREMLKKYLLMAGELDMRMKTGQGDPVVLLETFVLDFCSA